MSFPRPKGGTSLGLPRIPGLPDLPGPSPVALPSTYLPIRTECETAEEFPKRVGESESHGTL